MGLRKSLEGMAAAAASGRGGGEGIEAISRPATRVLPPQGDGGCRPRLPTPPPLADPTLTTVISRHHERLHAVDVYILNWSKNCAMGSDSSIWRAGSLWDVRV